MTWVTYPLRILYGLYGWLVFGLCCLLGLVFALLVPVAGWRHRLISWVSRMIFVLSGVPPRVTGIDKLPEGSAVVVANHASYVDGMLLNGYLPHRFSFVIKGEMRNVPVAHFLLRRSGARFVERHEQGGSSRDARHIVKAARDGQALGFFPEGTFRAEPGVGRFRPGAFVAAVRGGMPVVPVAIFKTRELLREGWLLPRFVRAHVEVLDPILPDDPAFAHHRELAETARQRILAVLGEPDLCKVAPAQQEE